MICGHMATDCLVPTPWCTRWAAIFTSPVLAKSRKLCLQNLSVTNKYKDSAFSRGVKKRGNVQTNYWLNYILLSRCISFKNRILMLRLNNRISLQSNRLKSNLSKVHKSYLLLSKSFLKMEWGLLCNTSHFQANIKSSFTDQNS